MNNPQRNYAPEAETVGKMARLVDLVGFKSVFQIPTSEARARRKEMP